MEETHALPDHRRHSLDCSERSWWLQIRQTRRQQIQRKPGHHLPGIFAACVAGMAEDTMQAGERPFSTQRSTTWGFLHVPSQHEDWIARG